MEIWKLQRFFMQAQNVVSLTLHVLSRYKKDMMAFDKESGLILNPHESEESLTHVAPTLHQWDRCSVWMVPWLKKHEDLFMSTKEPGDEPAVPWV